MLRMVTTMHSCRKSTTRSLPYGVLRNRDSSRQRPPWAETAPPPRGQIDACENITFPQLLLRTVTKLTGHKMVKKITVSVSQISAKSNVLIWRHDDIWVNTLVAMTMAASGTLRCPSACLTSDQCDHFQRQNELRGWANSGDKPTYKQETKNRDKPEAEVERNTLNRK